MFMLIIKVKAEEFERSDHFNDKMLLCVSDIFDKTANCGKPVEESRRNK